MWSRPRSVQGGDTYTHNTSLKPTEGKFRPLTNYGSQLVRNKCPPLPPSQRRSPDRRQHLSRDDASLPHCAFAFWSSAVCPLCWRQSADAWYSVGELHPRGLAISHLLAPTFSTKRIVFLFSKNSCSSKSSLGAINPTFPIFKSI